MLILSPLSVWVLLMLDMALVLLLKYVKVLVFLLGLLTLSSNMLISGLCLDGNHGSWAVMLTSMESLVRVRLHLQDQMSVFDERLASSEGSGVGIKSGIITLVPPFCVESDEVIPPVEIEPISLSVISECLDIVVLDLPWHVSCIEALAPRVESWRPEVHHDGLALVQVLDRWIFSLDAAHLRIVDGPGDVVWRPGHLVDVPLVLRVEAILVLVGLVLGLTVTVDDIHGEWILLNRGYDLDIKLVPAAWVEVWTVPVGEEGADSSFLVGCLHARDEFTVGELLVTCDSATFVASGLSDLCEGDQSSSVFQEHSDAYGLDFINIII